MTEIEEAQLRLLNAQIKEQDLKNAHLEANLKATHGITFNQNSQAPVETVVRVEQPMPALNKPASSQSFHGIAKNAYL